MALTLIKRELFQGVGTLTSGSPGNFDSVTGTLHKRAGGPRVSPDTLGFSADLQAAQANTFGQFNNVAEHTLAGMWAFVKAAPGATSQQLLFAGSFGSWNWQARADGLYYGDNNGTMTKLAGPENAGFGQWIWVGVAAYHTGTTLYNVKYYYKLPGQAMVNVASYTGVNCGAATAPYFRFGSSSQAGQYVNGRIGGCSLYSFTQSDFSDVVYPADLLDPDFRMTWFVNPSTGNDNNDGTTPSTAWKTAAKITAESLHCGLFPAPSYALGDTLVIDTSTADLVVDENPLTFSTRGLNVKAPDEFQYWRAKLDVALDNSLFTKTAGHTNIYQYALDSQPNIVAWEDEKWLAHPNGADFAAVAATLDSTPGSFWTDGTTLYLHPLGSTNPISDGKKYTRSYYRDSGTFAIVLDAPDMNFADCYAGKTCLAAPADGDAVLAYVVGSGGSGAMGGTSRISNCYLFYGSKHGLGLVADASDSDVTVEDCQVEQCSPYFSQSPFVSYMGDGASANNVHRYTRCKTVKNKGLIGSTEGAVDNQSVFLAHNNGSGTQFSFIFTGCNFSKQSISFAACSSATITGGIIGGVTNYSPILNASQVLFDGYAIDCQATPATVTAKSCIFAPTHQLTLGIFNGFQTQGTVVVENCTIDLGHVAAGSDNLGFLRRIGATTLTFKNNVFLAGSVCVPAVFDQFVNTDTITSTNNLYVLGAGANAAYNYNDGATTASRTFAQWQALGFDASTQSVADAKLDFGYRPLVGSPALNAGVNLGPLEDFSGTTFAIRNDIGAYEGPIMDGEPKASDSENLLLARICSSINTIKSGTLPPEPGDSDWRLLWKICELLNT